uniref:Uncharacterized protein n=1 Tax=Sphaerodactylus townsendi TaxID=933632 RepID=A0ACB8EH56_9SAUR
MYRGLVHGRSCQQYACQRPLVVRRRDKMSRMEENYSPEEARSQLVTKRKLLKMLSLSPGHSHSRGAEVVLTVWEEAVR